MQISRFLVALIASAGLAACGGGGSSGGGGGFVSTPAPQVNTDVANLEYSEEFSATNGAMDANFDLAQGTTTQSQASDRSLSVGYDAASDAYTVRTGGNTISFDPQDEEATQDAGQQRFRKQASGLSHYLTLFVRPAGSHSKTGSVGMGIYQVNSVAGGEQDTELNFFVYGFETPSTGVPRTGSMVYRTEVTGAVTPISAQPEGFWGTGELVVDFENFNFNFSANLDYYDLVDGGQSHGGGEDLFASGTLGSDGTFSGGMYHSASRSTGSLFGRFFGPDASELGASFTGSNASGGTLAGAFTGHADPSISRNTTMRDIRSAQTFYGPTVVMNIIRLNENGGITQTGRRSGWFGIEFDGAGGFQFPINISPYETARFSASGGYRSEDRRFLSFDSIEGPDVTVHLNDNSGQGLQFTYLNFGHYRSVEESVAVSYYNTQHFVYGLDRRKNVPFGRTGKASYSGWVFGSGSSKEISASFDVEGTTEIEVDFGASDGTGRMDLQAVMRETGQQIDMGTWTFDSFSGGLFYGGEYNGTIDISFFGPNGEELGGSFEGFMPAGDFPHGILVGGILVAKED